MKHPVEKFLEEYAALVRRYGMYVSTVTETYDDYPELRAPISNGSGMATPEEHIQNLYESEGLEEVK